MTIRTYGFDGAMRHGSLIAGTWDLDEDQPVLTKQEDIFKWTKKDDISFGIKATTQEIQRLAHAVTKNVKYRLPLGIDWDPDHTFSKSNRVQIVKHAYFMGYVTRGFQELGVAVAVVSPRSLREILGLKYNLKKVLLHEYFADWVDLPKLPSDDMDALIISYIMALAKSEESNESAQISLSSG